jgi:hypothetical protein
VDHPWRFFGPVIGLCVAWLVRSNKSSDNQDAYIRALDTTSPMHAREVTAVGKANTLTLEEWKGVVDAAFAAVEEQLRAQQRLCGTSSSSSPFLRLRPSEVAFLVDRVIRTRAPAGADTGPRRLRHAHILARAATGLALAESGALVYPADNDAVELMAAAALVEGGDAHAPWDVLPPKGVDANTVEDEPVDVLELLSLYGTTLGGRPEPPPPPPPPAEGKPAPPPFAPDPASLPYATPTQRLGVYVDMCARHRSLQQGGGAEPRAKGPEEAEREGEEASPQTFSFPDLAEAVALLARTHQIPTRARTGVVSEWPFKRYGLRSAVDALQEAAEETKVGLGEEEVRAARERVRGRERGVRVAAAAATAAVDALPADGTASLRRLTAVEARKLVLSTRPVCAWGECYGRD